MTLFIRWFCHHSSVRGAIYLTSLLKIKDFFFPRFQQTLSSIDANSHSHSTESMCVTLSHFLRHSWICTREPTTFVTNRRNNTRSSKEREREEHPVLPHSFPSFSSSFHFVHLAENKIRYSVNWHSWDRMRGKGVSSNRHFALTHSVERLGPFSLSWSFMRSSLDSVASADHFFCFVSPPLLHLCHLLPSLVLFVHEPHAFLSWSFSLFKTTHPSIYSCMITL